jgi:hypothetical protein
MKITNMLPALQLAPLALMSSMTFAQTIDVEITNLTHGLHFTPLLVSAHTDTSNLFQAGTAATAALQAMAEGGNTAPLVAASLSDTVNSINPAGGLLAPAMSTTVTDLDTAGNDVLSIVAMVLPTNDGFVGLNSWDIPEEAGTYTVYLNAYDAGTEVNDEIIDMVNGGSDDGIPADPGAKSGTGATGVATTENNTSVHIHRGTIGDTTLTGGISDLDSSIHRWLNPVAKVVVTVK